MTRIRVTVANRTSANNLVDYLVANGIVATAYYVRLHKARWIVQFTA